MCSHCKEIGHSVKRCKLAPITCSDCNSSGHSAETCPRLRTKSAPKTKRRRHSAKPRPEEPRVEGQQSSKHIQAPITDQVYAGSSAPQRSLISVSDQNTVTPSVPKPAQDLKGKGIAYADSSDEHRLSLVSEASSDSSDVYSSDNELEEGQYIPVRSRRKARNGRGIFPKSH